MLLLLCKNFFWKFYYANFRKEKYKHEETDGKYLGISLLNLLITHFLKSYWFFLKESRNMIPDSMRRMQKALEELKKVFMFFSFLFFCYYFHLL